VGKPAGKQPPKRTCEDNIKAHLREEYKSEKVVRIRSGWNWLITVYNGGHWY
jgi:hypothetical protein